MRMALSLSIAIAFLLSGCALSGGGPHGGVVPLKALVVDDPAAQLVKLSYTNDTGGIICLDPGNWPSSGGYLTNTGTEFYLEINGAPYYLRRVTDYCMGCATEVQVGQRVDGFLKYSSFGLPPELYNESKELFFTPIAFRCAEGLRK